jgi:hypothetical protein
VFTARPGIDVRSTYVPFGRACQAMGELYGALTATRAPVPVPGDQLPGEHSEFYEGDFAQVARWGNRLREFTEPMRARLCAFPAGDKLVRELDHDEFIGFPARIDPVGHNSYHPASKKQAGDAREALANAAAQLVIIGKQGSLDPIAIAPLLRSLMLLTDRTPEKSPSPIELRRRLYALGCLAAGLETVIPRLQLSTEVFGDFQNAARTFVKMIFPPPGLERVFQMQIDLRTRHRALAHVHQELLRFAL